MQIKQRKQYRRTKQITRPFLLAAAFLLTVLVFLILSLEQKLRPVALHTATMKSREFCVDQMQDAVRSTLEDHAELYRNVFEVKQDSSGRIRGAMCDPLALTALQNELEKLAGERLSARPAMKFSIPIGTLTGLQLMNGRGPGLSVAVHPLSYVQSRLETEFQEAGVNQTLLNIDIVLSVNIGTVLAGMQTTDRVETQVRIAQLMTAGDVPQFYSVRTDAEKSADSEMETDPLSAFVKIKR